MQRIPSGHAILFVLLLLPAQRIHSQSTIPLHCEATQRTPATNACQPFSSAPPSDIIDWIEHVYTTPDLNVDWGEYCFRKRGNAPAELLGCDKVRDGNGDYYRGTLPAGASPVSFSIHSAGVAKNAVSRAPYLTTQAHRFQVGTRSLSAVSRATAAEGDPSSYLYHPQSTLALGRGFSPSDTTAAKFPCISFVATKMDPGPPSTSFKFSYVTSQAQLSSALGLDAKIDASYLTFSGNATFKFETAATFDAKTINVVVQGRSDYGRWGIDPNAKLVADAIALLGDGAAFEKKCGSRYVAVEHRASSVFAIITLSNVRADQRDAFIADMGGGGGWGPLTAKAQTRFSLELRRAVGQGRVVLSVLATGGTGLSGLKDTLTSASAQTDNLTAILAGLGTFLGGFSESNAAAVQYDVASMNHFGWSESALDPWTDLQETRLHEIVAAYRTISSDLAQAKGIVNNTDVRSQLYGVITKQSIATMIPYLEGRLTDLASDYRKCKLHATGILDTDCPSVSPYSFSLPPLPDPPSVEYWGTLTFAQPDATTGKRYRSLSSDETGLILKTPEGSRLMIASMLDPRAIAVSATTGVSGSYVQTMRYSYFEPTSDGAHADDEWKMTLDTPVSSGTGWIWLIEDKGGATPHGERDITTLLCAYKGTHSGRFAAVFDTRFSKSVRYDLAAVSWDSSPHGCTIRTFDYLY